MAVECDDFQVAVLMNQVEYKEQRNYGISVEKCYLIYAFYFLRITSPKWSSWHAVHSCNCDQKRTITLQQAFISGSNIEPDVLFRHLT